MFKGIDLFSDTVTRPSKAMLKAMMEAEVGDEQKNEDPTTSQLEAMVAEQFGFSAAMFLPSATMANEIAVRYFCGRGEELIAAERCHLFMSEAGGPAIHANAMCKPIPTTTGIFNATSIRDKFNFIQSPHFPISKLMSVENSTNFGGGEVWSRKELHDVVQCADELQLNKHMDGSRIFNASVASNMKVSEITHGFDAVTLCLSKGLGCPTGALLIFDKKHYGAIRKLKQLMGGAMRQSGILAAAGIYALQNNIARLIDDHKNAKLFAELMSANKNVQILNPNPQTNMVFFAINKTGWNDATFLEQCVAKGVRFSLVAMNRFRAVTHLDVDRNDVMRAAEIVNAILK